MREVFSTEEWARLHVWLEAKQEASQDDSEPEY